MNRDYIDIDGKDPRPVLELHRQNVQDEAKIKHKLGSPRVVWNFPNVGKDSIDNDIAPLIEGMGPGDRLALNMPEGSDIIQETLDGQLRFGEVTKNLTDEVTVGLQSSKTRLLTDPSAMADAKEAGEQDDDRILGIMKKLKAFMERHVIPRVTGMELGEVEFKWGAKDSFDLTMPPAIEKALDKNILPPKVALQILIDNFRWKLPDKIDPEVIALLDEAKDEEPKPVNSLEPKLRDQMK